jgi:hypothetical protein
MTEQTTYSRTDASPSMPRWLALVLATVATLIAIGALWSLAPSTIMCSQGGIYSESVVPGILPGPQPCAGTDGTTPALVTAGILLALLATLFIVAFTVIKHRMRVLLILGGAMLLVLIVGLLATATLANAQPPVIYY